MQGVTLASSSPISSTAIATTSFMQTNQRRYDRMLLRAEKLRMALGGEPGTAHWITLMPKGCCNRRINANDLRLGGARTKMAIIS